MANPRISIQKRTYRVIEAVLVIVVIRRSGVLVSNYYRIADFEMRWNDR